MALTYSAMLIHWLFQDELNVLNKCDRRLNSGDVVQLIKCNTRPLHSRNSV